MANISTATLKQLAYQIKGRGDKSTPRFAILLGAGASVQSGIPTARDMIREFKEQIFATECPETWTEEEKERWLTQQPWYRADKEYSLLFERCEPKEYGRQRYIERMIEGKQPSFGYLVLATLMASNLINTVLTTNFDDLVYSACTTYSDIRPIVFAYGLMASEMRMLTTRPKILKLHGDYLYSALKNTQNEVEALDANMSHQVSNTLTEFGLIVVGYGGNDQSVMSILSRISPKNDLYWCVRRGQQPNQAVTALLEEKRGFLIEIEDFDQMMNEISRNVGFNAQHMLNWMEQREDEMITELKRFPLHYQSSSVFIDFIDALKEHAVQQTRAKKYAALENFARGFDAHRSGRYPEAEAAYRQALTYDPNADTYYYLGNLLLAQARYPEAIEAFDEAIKQDQSFAYPYDARANAYFGLGNWEQAEADYQRAIERDKQFANPHNGLGAILLKRRSLQEATQHFAEANRIAPQDHSALFNMGTALALQGRYDQAREKWKAGSDLSNGEEVQCKISCALYQLLLGDPEGGVAALRKILSEGNPGDGILSGFLEDVQLLASAPHPPQGIQRMVSLLRPKKRKRSLELSGSARGGRASAALTTRTRRRRRNSRTRVNQGRSLNQTTRTRNTKH